MKRELKTGVTLTELLIFLWVFALFATTVVTFLARISTLCAQSNKKCDAVAVISSIGDMLAHDVYNADTERDTITVRADHIAFFNAQQKITWKLKDAKLLRTIQRFDAHVNEWKKPYTQHVADNITSLTCKPIHKQRGKINVLKGITCDIVYTIMEQKRNASYTLAFRNGVV
jgi:hypothetical protein